MPKIARRKRFSHSVPCLGQILPLFRSGTRPHGAEVPAPNCAQDRRRDSDSWADILRGGQVYGRHLDGLHYVMRNGTRGRWKLLSDGTAYFLGSFTIINRHTVTATVFAHCELLGRERLTYRGGDFVESSGHRRNQLQSSANYI